MSAPYGCALLVCRNAHVVELRNCSVVAQASAICAELGDGHPLEIKLVDNHLALHDPRGAALCVWTSDRPQQAGVRLRLEHNNIQAGRILAVAGLERSMEVIAEGNTLAFQEAVLSWVCSSDSGCRPVAHWQGKDNRFRGPSDWLMVNGNSAGVCGLRAWREFWQATEAGSIEKTTSSHMETVRPEPVN